jgi:hypothetical protein
MNQQLFDVVEVFGFPKVLYLMPLCYMSYLARVGKEIKAPAGPSNVWFRIPAPPQPWGMGVGLIYLIKATNHLCGNDSTLNLPHRHPFAPLFLHNISGSLHLCIICSVVLNQIRGSYISK